MIIMFWIAGWMFSVGLCNEDTRGIEGLKVVLLFLFLWPLLVGCHIRTFVKTGEL